MWPAFMPLMVGHHSNSDFQAIQHDENSFLVPMKGEDLRLDTEIRVMVNRKIVS